MNSKFKTTFLNLYKRQNHKNYLKYFSDQFHYGHIEVLRESLNLPEDSIVTGTLQHGAFPEVSESLYKTTRAYRTFFSEAPFFAWSEFTARMWESHGGHAVRIASPWVHLVKASNTNRQGNTSSERIQSLVYFPTHSYPGHEYKNIKNSAELLLKTIKSLKMQGHEINNATAYLYWADFLDPDVRLEYQNRGLNFSCVGYRGNSATEIPSDNIGGRSRFLHKLFEVLMNSNLVMLEEISTTFWYAAYLGKPILLVDSPMNFVIRDVNGHAKKEIQISNIDAIKYLELPSLPSGEIFNLDNQFTELSKLVLGEDSYQHTREALAKYIHIQQA